MMQKYCLSSRLQQRPWIGNTYKLVTCKFSKSCGPVRYSPRSTKQPKNPSTPEHTKSHQHDVEKTNKHVPPMPSLARRFQDPVLAESLQLKCDLTKQNGETHAKSGFSLGEENDFSSASAKAPRIFESRGIGARDSKRSFANSAEVFEAYRNTQDTPMNSLDFSQQSSAPSKWFHHSGKKYEEEACTLGGFLSEEEEEENRPTTYDRQYAAEWRDKGPRHSQESSIDLAKFPISTKMQQSFGTEARNNVGSISILENGLDSAVEKAQTKEKNPFACMEANVERKTCPQSVESTPILGKNLVRREPDFKEGKRMPCKDAESFLLKVQKAKRRDWEPLNKSHAAVSPEDSGCIDDINNERDDSDDDRCLFLGQETLDENEDVGGVNFKDLVLNSRAAQEHAKNQAIRYLAMRPYTASQLRRKLESKNITSKLADYALATVQKCGLQSDLAYAETFSRARFNHGSWGPQRIKLGLKQRGISNDIIQVAIASVFHEEENDSEQYGMSENDTKSNSSEMSRAAMDHLLVQATKQWNRGRNATNETKIRRMISWLQYRGFNYSVIKTILKHLQQQICIEDE